MTQPQFNQLVTDAYELHLCGDMTEVCEFLYNISGKYTLNFDSTKFNQGHSNILYYDVPASQAYNYIHKELIRN